MESMATTRMSTRGQIIIPKSVRTATKSSQETLFAVAALDENTIVLKRIDREALLEEFRKLRRSVHKRFSDHDIADAVKAERRHRH